MWYNSLDDPNTDSDDRVEDYFIAMRVKFCKREKWTKLETINNDK